MNIITTTLIDEILAKANQSPRKRAMHCFHNPNDRLQRMINAGLEDTYVRPHKHENPDKLEIMTILKGQVGIIFFDEEGAVDNTVILDENGDVNSVEIPPRTWHCFVILSKEAALFEIIDGEYDEKTHKQFAPWAPEEGSEKATDYVQLLKKSCE